MVLLVGTLIGCGAGQQKLSQQLLEIQNEMKDLSESHKALVQRCENIQNRLELVEDRKAGQALRRSIRPRLPVVRMEPPKRVDPISTQPPATITQADLDKMLPKKKRAPRRRAVAPPQNASGAGNVGIRRLPPKSSVIVGNVPRVQPAVGGPQDQSDDPISTFKRAESLFRGGNLATALRELQVFSSRWPKHGYADNARMLVGKGRFQRAEYRAALSEFQAVLSDYPEGSEVPEALLMIGLTLDRLGQTHQAGETLARLKAMFPATQSGRRAAQVLLKMNRRQE
jgi:TolA-binding protein